MTADQLRECPFCNGDAHLTTRSEDERSGYNQRYTISCTKCGASVFGSSKQDKNGWINDPLREGLAATRAKWNARPTAVASHAEGEVVAIVGEQADTWKIAAYREQNTGWIPPGDKIKTAFFLKDVPIGTSLYSHPPRSGDEATYRKIARLIGQIFFYGDFKAETYNERMLEALLRKTGNFHETQSQADAAMTARGGIDE